MPRDYAAIAEQYARSVVDGDVPACAYVRMACQRHLDDLAQVGDENYAYRFDEKQAAKACRFIELLPHTKGRWARKSERLVLQPWQVFIVANIFGWLRTSDGLRRFRVVYIEVPRKNGKSILAAAIALYMFACDNEYGAEVYSGATSEKQAWEVFRPARAMALKTPKFLQAFGVEVGAKNLSIPENGSRMEPVIGKPGDGASPSCAIVDEFHEHDSDELYDTMDTGMGAREQPLMFVITTAGDNIAGPCYAKRDDVILALNGAVPNDRLFGVIYTIDEDDDWKTEAALRKANPNYDVSVSGEFLQGKVRDAVNSSRKQNVVKTKHTNLWVSSRSAWMNMEAWANCAGEFDASEFDACWIGLDLASKIDITSAIKLYQKDDVFYLTGRHYLPEARIETTDNRHYQGWVHDGRLISTPGNVIDHDWILEDLRDDAAKWSIPALGYDPYNATQLAVQLVSHGINAIEIRQTVENLSDPMKWLEALVLAGRLVHDNNPAMNWMMSNVTARVDAKDNVFPRKEREEKKIDGPVAAIIAMCVAQAQEETQESVYKTRGLRTL